jgi:hypothetical protein
VSTTEAQRTQRRKNTTIEENCESKTAGRGISPLISKGVLRARPDSSDSVPDMGAQVHMSRTWRTRQPASECVEDGPSLPGSKLSRMTARRLGAAERYF